MDRFAGRYFCTVVQEHVRVIVEQSTRKEETTTLFSSCTGHPACGMFPQGLPLLVDPSPGHPVGCPFVANGYILRWIEF